MKILDVSGKELKTLDLSSYPNLEKLLCDFNELTHLDVSPCPKLLFINISHNLLTEIDLSKNQQLNVFICNRNKFTKIPILPRSIKILAIANNPITNFRLQTDFAKLDVNVQDTIKDMITGVHPNQLPSHLNSSSKVSPNTVTKKSVTKKSPDLENVQEVIYHEENVALLPRLNKIGNKILKEEIMEAFDYYVSFSKVKNCDKVPCLKPVLNKLGKTSNNGFIYEIRYEAEVNNSICSSKAILKSNINNRSDNLMYEYMAGCYINNHYVKRFPCFIETYGVFRYKTEEIWNSLGKSDYKNFEDLRMNMDLINCAICPNNSESSENILIKNACKNPREICILIENIDEYISLYDLLKTSSDADLLRCVLFQLYYVLSQLSDEFTHYDLHGNNILLYKPGGLVYFHYEIENNKDIHFYCEYVVKIIDYGRCHVPNSKNIYEKLKKRTFEDTHYESDDKNNNEIPNCVTHSSMPFVYLETNHIKPQTRNKSFDLLMLNYMKKNGFFRNKTIVYKNEYDLKSMFGTKEIVKSGYPSVINNVDDAYFWFRDAVKEISNEPDLSNVLGNLFVYKTRPMVFRPTTNNETK
jgi:hypothetical protein